MIRKNRCFFKLLAVFIILILMPDYTNAYSLRQYSSKNGLSNSAILSVYQDRQGYMWFGSCDGLNLFDGLNIEVYKPTHGNNNLSGNLIESITETEDDVFWIQTNYGLDRFDRSTKTVKPYKEFTRRNFLAKDANNNIFIIQEDKYIYYNCLGDDKFKKIFIDDILFDDILDMTIDQNHIMWIFSKERGSSTYMIKKTEDNIIKLEPVKLFEHDNSLMYCFHNDNLVHFVDNEYILYEYNLSNRKKYYICDLRKEIKERGEVSSIVEHRGDYYIGFKTNGLIRLKNIPEQKKKYTAIEIDIKSGIFCLVKDRHQDIIWVGTDGQGVYMYFIDLYSIKSTTFHNISYPINTPIRALFVDKGKNLWIGTKGNGILRVHDFNGEGIAHNRTQHLTTGNSLLNNNSVYSFAKSRKNILWIGTEDGINYFSYKENKIKKLKVVADNKPVRYVHSICEFNDSILWIATVGEGVIKAKLSGSPDNPVIGNAKRIIINRGKQSYNYFFTTYQENDSIIWFGNRGYGAFRVNAITNQLSAFQFDKDNSNQTLNDIFSIIKNDEGYWFGSSFGLIRQHNGQQEIFNESDGFPNNTIHAILEDENDNFWLSTNRGLIKFNIKRQAFQTYNQQNGLEVSEFSDGACFKDEESGMMFLGGINGFVTIVNNRTEQDSYSPPILFNKLSIFGKEQNIFDFLTFADGQKILELDHRQNFFSVSFTAIDYIDGNNYTYFYKLDELNNNWIENGNFNSIAFTDISPGNYTLLVKYKNRIDGCESPAYPILIKIHPPWHRTGFAYVIYFIILLLILFACIRISVKWYTMKKNSMIEKLNRQQREEIYESKLRFFTNITHELCTPLTLIHGPCEKIMSYDKTDTYIHKYASLIQHNTEKLNGLIQELIEFRRLDTGNKILKIRELPISEIVQDIAKSFEHLIESKCVDYQVDIAADIVWNSDVGCLNKIVTNLISNAFKYTFGQGSIIVKAYTESDMLNIVVSNTGKGIKKEDIPLIFDRYKILDNLGTPMEKGMPSRNGLGLAICHSMIKKLGGEISVESTPYGLTTFRVTLPHIEAGEAAKDVIMRQEPDCFRIETPPVLENDKSCAYDKDKATVLIIDDDPSMLWFVSDIFAREYNILAASNPDEALDLLNTRQPNLIISDVMMPGIDGISLARKIKSNKLLSHIPLILLSAKNDPAEQVRGIEAGADVYITKPFNVKYLEKIAGRFLKRKEDLKEYYHSAFSSFELENGTVVHKEDKAFFERLLQVIDSNVTNPDLSVDFLSSTLGYSSRQLYRRLKNVTEKTPNEIVKEYRLNVAVRLLSETNLSIDEILYKSGFNNRGNFFKAFSKQYGTTPKNYREQIKRELPNKYSS